jgi:hypothetical protein
MYLTPTLVQAINDARIRLGQYIPDEEAEALSDHIGYWDYATRPKTTGNPAEVPPCRGPKIGSDEP